MKRFGRKNEKLEKTMKSHLINLDTFGVWDNDYDIFIEKRAKRVSREIKKRIIEQDIDHRQQADLVSDYEPEATTIE